MNPFSLIGGGLDSGGGPIGGSGGPSSADSNFGGNNAAINIGGGRAPDWLLPAALGVVVLVVLLKKG